MSIRTLLARLAADRRGTSVTELALVAPLLTLFATGLIDVGQGMSERFTMQQAVNRSLEQLQAGPIEGDADSNDVDYAFLVADAAAAADVPPSDVSVRRWLECGNEPQPDFDDSCDLGEETARYLELRIDKLYEARFFLGDHALTASAAVRIQ